MSICIWYEMVIYCIDLHMVRYGHTGADPGFPVRGGGAHIKELRAKIVGVFRVKNHDFTLKNLIFSNFRWGGGGGGRRVRPPVI